MIISPLQARADKYNGAIAGDSNHRTSRFIDGNLLNAVVAIRPVLWLAIIAVTAFFVNAPIIKKLRPTACLPTMHKATPQRVYVGG